MFYKFYKIIEVKPKPDMKLLIQFENGIFKYTMSNNCSTNSKILKL